VAFEFFKVHLSVQREKNGEVAKDVKWLLFENEATPIFVVQGGFFVCSLNDCVSTSTCIHELTKPKGASYIFQMVWKCFSSKLDKGAFK
jgi:hypothetical protein